MTADSGLLLASVMTADKIGPVQGVHPAAKPIPMRMDPKTSRTVFELDSLFAHEERGLEYAKSHKTKENNEDGSNLTNRLMIIIKNFPTNDVPKPIAINIIENPTKKNKV